MEEKIAPNGPGMEPHWTRSSKDAVGSAYSKQSRIWFTLAKGVITEVYYPSIDRANTRQIEFIVTGEDFVSYEKYDATHKIEYISPGVPAYRVTTECKEGRYRLIKWIYSDPRRDSLVTRIAFEPLKGRIEDYRLFCYVTPHIDNEGYHNNGWIGDYKGVDLLCAKRNNCCMVVGSNQGFLLRSCGYVGVNDGWIQLKNNRQIQEIYTKVNDGNIGLTGELPLNSKELFISVSFGSNELTAGQMCRATLLSDPHLIFDHYKADWEESYLNLHTPSHEDETLEDFFRTSVMVMKCHRTKLFEGSVIASLSIPWGKSQGDANLGGYHLIWPRDLVETAAGLSAAGDSEAAREILFYLMCTQDKDGHWPQCMWVTGEAYWPGIQMDETAMPILLANRLAKHDQLQNIDPQEMICKAVCYIVQNGPVTQEDRWEENGGYTPFTLANEISALLVSAETYEQLGNSAASRYLIEMADCWNSLIEQWIYVEDTDLAKEVGVKGYYIRIAPDVKNLDIEPSQGDFHIKNIPWKDSDVMADQIVSCDALALVRFGLRDAKDPRILDTVKVIDHLLRTDTKTGPVWHRYNDDGYGEHEDGSPYNGTGVGRGWPLMVGERGHYELARGDKDLGWKLLKTMCRQSNAAQFFPEQIWESADIPKLDLFNGHPSGSAMPLVWTHSEYVRLFRSLSQGRVFDLIEPVYRRYVEQKVTSNLHFWRFNHRISRIDQGKRLRIEAKTPFRLQYSLDGWATSKDVESVDTTLGIWYVDLETEQLLVDTKVAFTFYWSGCKSWEKEKFEVRIAQAKHLATTS